MNSRNTISLLVLLAACGGNPEPPAPAAPPPPAETGPAQAVLPMIRFKQHDSTRAQPPVARPAVAIAMRAPADAIVLFDGTSLDEWAASDGSAAKWKLENGYMEVVPGTGDIRTKGEFGDVQLHIEWSAPLPPEGEGQERGNSGVFLMRQYEVQVLDSYGSFTYPDGQAGAIYGQYPPLANASLPPGEWQSYDIVFHAPRFVGTTLVAPARFTVLHNGVLVQDDVALVGPTTHGHRGAYAAHAARLPLSLQDHGQPVRYRNIWIRDLRESEE